MQPTTSPNLATPTTTRRGFLGHVAGAYFAAGAITTTVALADPLADMIDAYRQELQHVNELPGDPPDDFVWRAMNALDADVVPVPCTRATALDALRLAKAECTDMSAPPMVLNLVTAALAFFEANA
ncbi:MAG: hypothetical protein B7Z30_00565 [Rhizobiales bacterium 12-68-15]|nr:MAG: hypothetical protein B7Z30_00565 [Rhizobiales bacterium 12-68-15]